MARLLRDRVKAAREKKCESTTARNVKRALGCLCGEWRTEIGKKGTTTDDDDGIL